MRLTVKDAWDSYLEKVVPKSAGAVQTLECRRAFYAGFWAMLQVAAGLGSPDVTEESGVGILKSLLSECENFVADALRGKT